MELFIDEVVKKIWEPVTEKYKEIYDKSMELSEEELFEEVQKEISRMNNVVYESKALNMTMLATSGCPHNNRNGVFSGCSMCDYNSKYVTQLAMMGALKKKNATLYGKASRFSFDNSRGKTPRPGVVELISAHDCLNDEEFPEPVFNEIFGKDDLFSRKPFKAIFETRLSSITYQGLMKWKEKIGRQVVVEFGYEVANEWVRNHWINKNVSDKLVEEAFQNMKKADCGSSANILIGIPGLTDDYSLELFKDSCRRLVGYGSDFILCSPLARKKMNMQGYIYDNMVNNKRLQEYGLVSGVFTSIPSVFTVFEAIRFVVEEMPNDLGRLTLSPSNFPIYFEQQRSLYKDYPQVEKITEYLIDVFTKFNQKKNIDEFLSAKDKVYCDDCYKLYCKWKEKQKKAGSLKNVITVLGEEIAYTMWGTQADKKLTLFYEELKSFPSFEFDEC